MQTQLHTKTHTRYTICILFLLMSAVWLFIAPDAPAQAQDGPPITLDGVWDGESRFTMLILGMDRRPGARNNFNARTDVIMLMSYDPQEGQLGLLSIPRDIHLSILDIGELMRANTLMVEGESRQEGYGPYFAMDTIQYNLGMYVDAYLVFDFEAFITLIDAIGGVTVNVPYAISDPTFPDMNYGFDPLFIPAGENRFDGRRALQYARTRHQDSDFLRGERQLQIVQAAAEKLRDPATAQRLIAQVPTLLSDLDGHLYTNMPTEQAIALGWEIMLLPADNITMGALGPDYSYTYRGNFGTVLVPDRQLLAGLLRQLFGDNYIQ